MVASAGFRRCDRFITGWQGCYTHWPMTSPARIRTPQALRSCLSARVHAYPMEAKEYWHEMSLMALPTDVLHTIIHHIIDPLDLCAVEQCCWVLRELIDDNVWRNLFLSRRRGTVLREPECWKKEMERRDSFSKDWRKLTGSSCPKMRLSQKLRLMISLGAISRKADSTLVVDAARREGSFATISEALSVAKPFDTLLVRPGEYAENIKLTDHIEIVGTGPVGSVVLSGTVDHPVVEVAARVSCRIANVFVKQTARDDGVAMSSAVLIKGGASLVVEESVISSEIGHCIVIQGHGTSGHVLHNAIANGKGVGILVCEEARGVIEDNDISCSGRAGVAILSGGDPLVCQNRIRDGLDSGVLVSEKGRGRVEDNDICGNRRAGVAILKEGAPLVLRNKIHRGHDSGVLVCENGQGSVKDNEIFANQMAGVAIGLGGASVVTGNTIRDGSGGSLCLSQHSKGMISSNVIHHHTNAAMQVPEELIGELKTLNEIRYDNVLAC